MSEVLAIQDRDWVVITRMDGPRRLKRELWRVLGTDCEQDERGATRVARAAWDAALAVFRRYDLSVTLTAPAGAPAGQPPAVAVEDVSAEDVPAAVPSGHPEGADAPPAPEVLPADEASRREPRERAATEVEEGNVGTDVRQQAIEDERAAAEEIASLQARIEELERKREELRQFVAMYERYAGHVEEASTQRPYASAGAPAIVVD